MRESTLCAGFWIPAFAGMTYEAVENMMFSTEQIQR
jgi:hypothetical protein